MSALTATFLATAGGARFDKGEPTPTKLKQVTFSVSPGNNQTNEWVSLTKIIRSVHSIVGAVQTAGTATPILVQANKQGTGGAASAGSLAFQVNAASTTFQITVRGIPV